MNEMKAENSFMKIHYQNLSKKKGAVPEGRAPYVGLLLEKLSLIRRLPHDEDVATKRQNPTIESIAREQDELVANFWHDIILDVCRESCLFEHGGCFSRTCLWTTDHHREAVRRKYLLANSLIVVDDDCCVVPQQSLMSGPGVEGESLRQSCEFAKNRGNDFGGLLVWYSEATVSAIRKRKRIADETEDGYSDCPDESNQKQPQWDAHRANLLFQRCYHDSLVARVANLPRTILNKLILSKLNNFLSKSQEAASATSWRESYENF